ncbi:hypothetical protein ISN45_At03g034560 [Arabidopsis thaliana x Arabidopsis arenosa]|uniref:Uncharacterized protein n=1 Tax=Arabidopsis thaliana x Arabidopsis arenosa TaxID=1240361 RepID=A0A8T2F025_9BRAS|nr:hypothetical protein ISN45_At03g034560 [Arabidopsis thaliana x Arabidopsis arenosa]
MDSCGTSEKTVGTPLVAHRQIFNLLSRPTTVVTTR